jgi:hypothetical protein
MAGLERAGLELAPTSETGFEEIKTWLKNMSKMIKSQVKV